MEDLKNRQEALIGARQEITQRLKVLVKDGQEAARRLRGAVKANLGTKNERLVQFKMAPNRPRGPPQVEEEATRAAAGRWRGASEHRGASVHAGRVSEVAGAHPSRAHPFFHRNAGCLRSMAPAFRFRQGATPWLGYPQSPKRGTLQELSCCFSVEGRNLEAVRFLPCVGRWSEPLN